MISFSSLINSFRRKRLDKQIEYLENNLNYLGARIDEAYAYGLGLQFTLFVKWRSARLSPSLN